jgi:hypothetical protein
MDIMIPGRGDHVSGLEEIGLLLDRLCRFPPVALVPGIPIRYDGSAGRVFSCCFDFR